MENLSMKYIQVLKLLTLNNFNGCKQYEKAKIFDGKTIYEAEKDIEVLFA